MRRLVRSPPAPKIVMVAGEGRRAERHIATVAAASAELLSLLFSQRWGKPDEHQLRPVAWCTGSDNALDPTSFTSPVLSPSGSNRE